MPAVTRELSIAYGAFSVGGSTDRSIDSYVQISKNYTTATLEFNFVIHKTTEADFATEVAAVEAAYRMVRQNVTVTQGSATLESFSQSTFSGFDSFATVIKQEDVADTGRSRRYTVRIEFGMPADSSNSGSGTSGRRSSKVNVAYDPARIRTVTITGTYTGLSSVNARSQYLAQIDALGVATMSALGITEYDVVDEPTTESNTASTLLDFTRVYREIIYPESIGATNDPAVIRQTLTFSPRSQAPGDSPKKGVKRLIEVTAIYDAWIDRNITQDLKAKWENGIRGFIVQKAKTVFNAGTVAIIHEDPIFDPVNNKISARVELWSTSSSAVLQSTVQTVDTRMHGTVAIAVWEASGNPFSRYLFQGPAQLRRTIMETTRYLASSAPPASLGSLPAAGSTYSLPSGLGSFSAPDIFIVSSEEERIPLRIGLSGINGSNFIDVVDFVQRVTFEFVNIVKSKANTFTFTPESGSLPIATGPSSSLPVGSDAGGFSPGSATSPGGTGVINGGVPAA